MSSCSLVRGATGTTLVLVNRSSRAVRSAVTWRVRRVSFRLPLVEERVLELSFPRGHSVGRSIRSGETVEEEALALPLRGVYGTRGSRITGLHC